MVQSKKLAPKCVPLKPFDLVDALGGLFADVFVGVTVEFRVGQGRFVEKDAPFPRDAACIR